MPDETRDEWARLVLGVDPGVPSVGGGTAPRRSGIDYNKLLLRWRAAQAQAADNFGKLAASVLALKEVHEDPRLDHAHVAGGHGGWDYARVGEYVAGGLGGAQVIVDQGAELVLQEGVHGVGGCHGMGFAVDQLVEAVVLQVPSSGTRWRTCDLVFWLRR
jgi:hypothetical protein